MKIATAKEILSIDIATLRLEELQRHIVRLLDAWRESKGDYGLLNAVQNGFLVPMQDVGATGYVPADKWLTQNLQLRLDEAQKRHEYLLSHPE